MTLIVNFATTKYYSKISSSSKGYAYYGLENGNECFCGFSDSYFIPTKQSECKKTCSGSQNEICGGSWRLSLYECKIIGT